MTVGTKGPESLPSPYLTARREWDERYGDLVTRARNWRGICFLALCALLLAIVGMIIQAGRAHVIPYVVAVDSLGRVVAQGNANEGGVADGRMKRAALYDWVVAVRMVSIDRVAERGAIDKAYSMIANGSQALTYINNYYRDNSPVTRSR